MEPDNLGNVVTDASNLHDELCKARNLWKQNFVLDVVNAQMKVVYREFEMLAMSLGYTVTKKDD